jgi:hypothetical protein
VDANGQDRWEGYPKCEVCTVEESHNFFLSLLPGLVYLIILIKKSTENVLWRS